MIEPLYPWSRLDERSSACDQVNCRLDSCDIPKYPIGVDETLDHIHRLDFSDDWAKSIALLIKAVVE
jgi:hypothetical protein